MSMGLQDPKSGQGSSLSDLLGRLAGDLSQVRNPLANLLHHLNSLADLIDCKDLAFAAVAVDEDEELATPILSSRGTIEVDLDPFLRNPPSEPQYMSASGDLPLLLAPVLFGGQPIALLIGSRKQSSAPSPAVLDALASYGRIVAPTIERAMLRHRLAENERLLHARSMGEMRAVRAVKTANEMRREAEDKLLHAAFHDSLTGLPNRTLFMDRLAHALRRAARQERVVFAILCVGIDRFKVVNESLGHGAGDTLLREVADRLQQAVRPSDTLARLGGDVFTVLLEDIGGIGRANRVADRIQKSLGKAFILDDQEFFATSGIGIALSKGDLEAGELLRNAELALHRAKQRGRSEKEVFDLEMHSAAMALLELETDLRKGLSRKEFRVHYQPVYRLADGRLKGFEALVRWQHPRRGLLAPGAFLGVAEESGLIVQLGEWVLEESCRQLKSWTESHPAAADLSVAVNVSDRQIHRPELVSKVVSCIDASGLDRSRIALEITENLVMEHADRAQAVLRELNEGGLELHLDDFGTGYSSLSYLRRLPLNCLKIDRSFVFKIDNDREDMAVVQAIVMLAKSLGLAVIAEGIETKKQLEIVTSLGCEYGQGYYFDKPLPADEAEELIIDSSRS